MTIEPMSRWKYVGNGWGNGLIHFVVGMEDGEVATWSDPTQRIPGQHTNQVAGYTWLGPVDDFLKQFKPA